MNVKTRQNSPAGLVIDHGNVGFIPNVDGQHPLGGRFSFPSFPAANSQNSQGSVHFFLKHQAGCVILAYDRISKIHATM